MEVKRITDELSVGGQPAETDLQELASNGFKTVINLRAEGEENQDLSPAVEGERAREIGLNYRHIPVTMKNAKPEQVDRFRSELAVLPKPAYIHCQGGGRASVFTLIDLALKSGLTAEQAMEQATKLGFNWDRPEVREFVTEYVEKHRKKQH